MRFAFERYTLLLAVVLSTGCGRFVFKPSGPQPVTISPEQQQALAQQTEQIQSRVAQLDTDNQQLESLLAQSRQQIQLLEDQLLATQGQLRETVERLASARSDNDQLRNRSTALAASLQKQSGAEIRANNSLLRNLTITNLPGVEVRQDGDVIRVELPGDQLFYGSTPQLKPGAEALIRSVAVDLLRNYPNQLIGIEGHTDNGPAPSPQYPTPHHLSTARAMSVYEALTRSVGAPSGQLFVIGHGANHPLVSNATDAGRARNQRVELVVYPDTMRR